MIYYERNSLWFFFLHSVISSVLFSFMARSMHVFVRSEAPLGNCPSDTHSLMFFWLPYITQNNYYITFFVQKMFLNMSMLETVTGETFFYFLTYNLKEYSFLSFFCVFKSFNRFYVNFDCLFVYIVYLFAYLSITILSSFIYNLVERLFKL